MANTSEAAAAEQLPLPAPTSEEEGELVVDLTKSSGASTPAQSTPVPQPPMPASLEPPAPQRTRRASAPTGQKAPEQPPATPKETPKKGKAKGKGKKGKASAAPAPTAMVTRRRSSEADLAALDIGGLEISDQPMDVDQPEAEKPTWAQQVAQAEEAAAKAGAEEDARVAVLPPDALPGPDHPVVSIVAGPVAVSTPAPPPSPKWDKKDLASLTVVTPGATLREECDVGISELPHTMADIDAKTRLLNLFGMCSFCCPLKGCSYKWEKDWAVEIRENPDVEVCPEHIGAHSNIHVNFYRHWCWYHLPVDQQDREICTADVGEGDTCDRSIKMGHWKDVMEHCRRHYSVP